jgi:hypothetical protein
MSSTAKRLNHNFNVRRSDDMSNKSSNQNAGSRMTQSAASRIQSATSRSHGGQTPAGSFASRAQSAAAHHANNAASSRGGAKK